MKNNTLNTDFVRCFRQENMVYPGNKAKQYQNILFRQFTGTAKEITILKKSLGEQLDDREIMASLIVKLEKKGIPGTQQLIGFIKNLHKKISSYVSQETCSPDYYNSLLSNLEKCSALLHDFRNTVQNKSLDELKILTSCKGPQKDITRADIDRIQSGTERYSGRIWKYFDHFITLLQRESANSRGVCVTTRVEQYLLKLVRLIETVLINIETTLPLLEEWKEKLIRRESQEIYN